MVRQHCIRILSSQCCPNTSETTLHKKFTHLMLPSAHRHVLAGKLVIVSNMFASLFLTGYSITKQSWLFLFNAGSIVHLRLAAQQWTGVNIDWNKTLLSTGGLLLFVFCFYTKKRNMKTKIWFLPDSTTTIFLKIKGPLSSLR